MKNNISTFVLVICLFLLIIFSSVRLEGQSVPPLINYQGRLANSNGVPASTGDYELRFHIWDAASGGNRVWGPQVFNGQTGPGFGSKVPVVQGYFNVMLGPNDTNGAPVVSAFAGTNRFVEIQIGANSPIAPRQQILTAPYAFYAQTAAAVATNAVAETNLADNLRARLFDRASVTNPAPPGGIAILPITDVSSNGITGNGYHDPGEAIITSRGNPIFVGLTHRPGGTAVSSISFTNNGSGGAVGNVYIRRGGPKPGYALISDVASPGTFTILPSSIWILDNPGPGEHRYTFGLQTRFSEDSTFTVKNVNLIAYELQ